jgi:hypothetical protein
MIVVNPECADDIRCGFGNHRAIYVATYLPPSNSRASPEVPPRFCDGLLLTG